MGEKEDSESSKKIEEGGKFDSIHRNAKGKLLLGRKRSGGKLCRKHLA